ncbi:MAG: hypothetical protein GX053_11390 [Tissierella sp.]|nr:hypothetical protein [Tissierella sp.]
MKKYHIFLSLILALAILLSAMPSDIMAEEIVDLDEKLSTITEEEKRIIEELFIGLQEIEGLERDFQALNLEIEELQEDVLDLENKISYEEEKYGANLSILEEIFKIYQRMGPASYLEIILESKDISDFLRRINVIRDLARNTDDILNSIEEVKEILVEEKNNLNEKLIIIEEKQKDLKETLDNKSKRIEEQEEYLRSLETDREYYEMYLNSLQEMMVEVEDLFANLKKQLPGIIANSYIPLESLTPKLSLQGIRLTISEMLFNEILGSQDDLPDIEFEFKSDIISMFIDEYNIIVSGKFSIYKRHSIEFIIEEVRYYDFLLEEKTIKDLIGESIIFDFEGLLEGSSIKNIKIFDEYMELTIDFKLF